MGKRILYVGSYNNWMSEKLFNKAVDYLKEKKGHKFYYILPNGNLLVNYRKAMISKINYAFDINLYTFDNIVDMLLKDKLYTTIDKETKEIIVANILKKLNKSGKLKYYGPVSNRKRFIKTVSSIIGEIKRSLITPEDYLRRCPKKPFYEEIGYIYEEYENILKDNNFMDREESFFYGLQILNEDLTFFKDLDFVVVDNFFDFRPQEFELLKAISKTNCSIYINMPFNRKSNFNTVSTTIENLSSIGFEIVNVDNKNYNQYEELANMIFSDDNEIIECDPPINIIKAANKYLEMKKIAHEIKYYLSKGIDLSDMAVVLTNYESYKDQLFQAFEEEKIPITLDKEISLMEIPLLKELIYVLDIKRYYMDNNTIINRIKSSYYSLVDKAHRELIEYIIRQEGVEGLKKYDMYYIVDLIKNEAKTIPSKATLSQYVKLVFQIMKKYNLNQKILNIYNETKDYNLARRDFLALNKFRQIMNTINSILYTAGEEVTLDEFIDIMSNYFRNESIVDIGGNVNGVNILTPITTRGKKYKVVFVTGMSQDNYPNVSYRNFFFKDDNYEELKKIGIDVKNYYERLDKEFVMFSNIIASCSDILYLSYSENLTEEDKSIKSIFLDEINSRVDKKNGIKTIVVEIDYLFKGNVEDVDDDEFKDIFMKNYCEQKRQLKDFNKFNGLITEQSIKEDLYNIHKDKVYSISYLETYRACPYKFLLSKIFKLDEMKREFEQISALDLGTIKHEVLKEYYFNYKDEIKNYILNNEYFNIEETYNFILKQLESKMETKFIDKDSIESKLIALNNANIILKFIKNDLKRMKNYKKKVIPYDFEVPFGEENTFEIKIGDEKYLFTGIIDRIDKYVDEDKYIIIDYKSKSYGAKKIKDIKEGLSLQLPLYIMSLGYEKIAAGVYGILFDGTFKEPIIVEEEAKNLNKKSRSKSVISRESLNEILEGVKNYIKNSIDSIQNGDFSVNPRECDKYCVYKDICRYQEVSKTDD